MVSWRTPSGIEYGMVVGTDGSDLLVGVAYDKSLKNDRRVKYYRDESLSQKISGGVGVPGIVMDIHRVPSTKAYMQGRLTGVAAAPYMKMGLALQKESQEEAIRYDRRLKMIVHDGALAQGDKNPDSLDVQKKLKALQKKIDRAIDYGFRADEISKKFKLPVQAVKHYIKTTRKKESQDVFEIATGKLREIRHSLEEGKPSKDQRFEILKNGLLDYMKKSGDEVTANSLAYSFSLPSNKVAGLLKRLVKQGKLKVHPTEKAKSGAVYILAEALEEAKGEMSPRRLQKIMDQMKAVEKSVDLHKKRGSDASHLEKQLAQLKALLESGGSTEEPQGVFTGDEREALESARG